MDERTAKLEAHVEPIQSDVTEIKGDLRRLSDRLDHKMAWLIGLMLTLAAGCGSGFLWLADKTGP